ncbi:tetratricopeptide repeat protein [Streptantibioticus ferralitis]|uniref:Tetratricopeptide repeat protein n=1 Tax=Streptantibioticus ferralitis TaxID=236510 RepID=A0ABT5YYI7_9ACTN|nr:tetratricopeptide repeat protein [Streptantibioticus ferralitis]MDF2256548.1 tetratricopeptide repeat protein [Streptantibioticus ferralitis]
MTDRALTVRTAACALPAAPPYFLGRRRELRELRADIDRPGLAALRGKDHGGCRVLLVAGRPGSGRTALAIRLAREVADRYPGGQYFVRLTGVDGEPVPSAQIARAVLRALGETGAEADGGAEAEDPVAALRSALAGRRVLVVLDDTATADQVLPLLPPGPGGLVIATSQGPLAAIPDVRPCTLGGLNTAASVELLSAVVGSTRVTCDPTAAEALAEECWGNPTALRLMAGWLAARPGMSVTDTIQALRAIPVSSAMSAPVARAFRLVHDGLTQPVARLLRLLALAPDGVLDAHTASALAGCPLSAAQAALRELLGYGLLHPEGTAGLEGAADADTEYRVPGCLHALLREQLDVAERPAQVRLATARMLERTVRRLQSCRAAAEPAGSAARRKIEELPRPLRFGSPGLAAGWLRGRLPVLLAAARVAVAEGELDTLAQRLIAALVRALDAHRGDTEALPELYELHGLLLEVAERRALPRQQAAALINLADLDTAAGRTKEALERYRTALDAARSGDDGLAAGRALEALGDSYLELDDPQRAADWYGRALALRQTRGEFVEQARLHARLAELHTRTGQYPAALREWRAAGAVHRRLRDLSGYAMALSEAARVHECAGQCEESLRTYRDALHWARQAADVPVEGAVLLRMADTLERAGDPAGARLQRSAAEDLLRHGLGRGPRHDADLPL